MSLQVYCSQPPTAHEEVSDLDYDEVAADPIYDEGPQLSYGEGVDPDYNQDFADPDAQEASQE